MIRIILNNILQISILKIFRKKVYKGFSSIQPLK